MMDDERYFDLQSAQNSSTVPMTAEYDGDRRIDLSDIFTMIDDKHVPLTRIVWISDLPHFCGNEECLVEGRYEIRIEGDDSVFGTREERDSALDAFENWLNSQ